MTLEEAVVKAKQIFGSDGTAEIHGDRHCVGCAPLYRQGYFYASTFENAFKDALLTMHGLKKEEI